MGGKVEEEKEELVLHHFLHVAEVLLYPTGAKVYPLHNHAGKKIHYCFFYHHIIVVAY